uniref:Sodium:solute symporter family protein n=1 Tax=Candidatus Kentrum sp. SD TaxID=2126332 RepID=A0A451BKR2_9GAMM|nr:MAG: Sodium:solute symporter family protein [Candidatus Kentron sp. SD]
MTVRFAGVIGAILGGLRAVAVSDTLNGFWPLVGRDEAYGTLARGVLPPALTGFFAAAMAGAIPSSFNSALNSTCTLFSLGVYKPFFNKGADDAAVIRSGKVFGWNR